MAGKYNLIKKLGEGTFGCVWKGVKKGAAHTHQEQQAVAVKKLRDIMLDDWNKSLFREEAECLRSLKHPNIVKLCDTYTDQRGDLHMVLEFMETDLFSMIAGKRMKPNFLENQARNVCHQVLKGLSYMHGRGYCHCDLKPENLLLSKNNVVKIADFGHAINMRESKATGEPLHPYVVSRPYRAPELLLKSSSYGFAIDMWSVGIILAQLYSIHPIFSDSSDPQEQLYNICSVIGSPDEETWPEGLKLAASMDYRFPKEFEGVNCERNLRILMPKASDEAIDLVKRLCSWDPKRRPTAQEALRHPFFKQTYINTGKKNPKINLSHDLQSYRTGRKEQGGVIKGSGGKSRDCTNRPVWRP